MRRDDLIELAARVGFQTGVTVTPEEAADGIATALLITDQMDCFHGVSAPALAVAGVILSKAAWRIIYLQPTPEIIH